MGLEPYFGGRRYAQDLEVLLRGQGGDGARPARAPRALARARRARLADVGDASDRASRFRRRHFRLAALPGGALAPRDGRAGGEALRRLEFLVRRFPISGRPGISTRSSRSLITAAIATTPRSTRCGTEHSKNMEEEADPHLIAIAHAVELEQQVSSRRHSRLSRRRSRGTRSLEVGREVYARLLAAGGRGSEAAAQYWRAITTSEGRSGDRAPALAPRRPPFGSRDRRSAARESQRLARRARRCASPSSRSSPLARAELGLERDPRKPDLALNRALEVLDEFRSATNHRSLDELDRGSTLRGSEFLDRATPDAAEALLRSGSHSPRLRRALALARGLPRGARPQGRSAPLYTDLCEMSESPRAHLGRRG